MAGNKGRSHPKVEEVAIRKLMIILLLIIYTLKRWSMKNSICSLNYYTLYYSRQKYNIIVL